MNVKEEMKELEYLNRAQEEEEIVEDVVVFRMNTNMAEDIYCGLRGLSKGKDFTYLTNDERTALSYLIECLDGCVNL